jgi:hypothetical protein
MWRLLHSQLHILQEENNVASGAGKCKPLTGGGSIKVLSKVGTFNTQATVEIYYDSDCKDVFIRSVLNFNQDTPSSVVFSQKADFSDMDGKKIGSLSLKANGKKASGSLVNFDGTGIWTPTKGTKVLVGLKCDYPETLKGAKPFTCSYALAQSFKGLKLDLGVAAKMTVAVVPVKNAKGDVVKGLFNGDFTGTAQIYRGDLGNLKVTAGKGDMGIGGGLSVKTAATLAGLMRLSVFWQNGTPKPNSWTVTHGQETFAAAMLTGPERNSAGTIVNLVPTTLATFNVDKAGAGTITYTPTKASAIVNWLVSE